MAKADSLSLAARRSVAEQLGQFVTLPSAPGRRATTEAAAATPELGESLAVCTVTAEQVRRPPEDLLALVEPSGMWHHQVYTAAGPSHVARSTLVGFDEGEQQVEQWLASPIAGRIDQAITWVDDQEEFARAKVRLLVFPAYYTHALAIIRGKNVHAVLVDAPEGFAGIQRQHPYPLAEFLTLLSTQPIAETLIPPTAAPRDVPAPMALETVVAPPTPRSQQELDDLMRQVTPTPHDIEQRVMERVTRMNLRDTLAEIPSKKISNALQALHAAGGAPMIASAIEGSGEFGGIGFYLYKRLIGIQWDKKGEFRGRFTLEQTGPRDYIYRPVAEDPFHFVRHNGEILRPGVMVTDGGSIPRVAWSVPGFDPFFYLKGYILHDWDFVAHHCVADHSRTFEDANLILGEAIYSMMRDGLVPPDWRRVEVIYQAVSSSVGRRVWDRIWTPTECQTTLP